MTQRSRYPTGLFCLSSLLKTIVTLAFVTPACPCLYTSSDRFPTRTCVRFEMPRTKQIASKMFDFPLPFRPPMAKTTRHPPPYILSEISFLSAEKSGWAALVTQFQFPVVKAWWSVKRDCSLPMSRASIHNEQVELTRIPGMQKSFVLGGFFPCQHAMPTPPVMALNCRSKGPTGTRVE